MPGKEVVELEEGLAGSPSLLAEEEAAVLRGGLG